MKPAFRFFRRKGIFYSENTRTGEQKSLKTRDKGIAQRLLNSKMKRRRTPPPSTCKSPGITWRLVIRKCSPALGAPCTRP